MDHLSRSEESESIRSMFVDNRVMKQIKDTKSQLEYYFSDINLLRDRYLLDLVNNNPSGYVNILDLLRFNKIKQILSDLPLTDKIEILIKAVETSNHLQCNTLRNKIKRKIPFKISKKLITEKNRNTLYIDGFNQNVSEEGLRGLFEEYGQVISVEMPKHKNGYNKGFAFVVFKHMNPDLVKKENRKSFKLKAFNRGIGVNFICKYSKWESHKKGIKKLGESDITGFKRKDEEWVYVQVDLQEDADNDIKDEVELSFLQFGMSVRHIRLINNRRMILRLNSEEQLDIATALVEEKKELLGYIKEFKKLKGTELQEHLNYLKYKREKKEDKERRTKKIKKLKNN